MIFGCPLPPPEPNWFHLWSMLVPCLFDVGRRCRTSKEETTKTTPPLGKPFPKHANTNTRAHEHTEMRKYEFTRTHEQRKHEYAKTQKYERPNKNESRTHAKTKTQQHETTKCDNTKTREHEHTKTRNAKTRTHANTDTRTMLTR